MTGAREKAILFDLTGTAAFFKRPDVNKNVYFTFSHIHRVALMGMLGAIWGKGGYAQQGDLDAPEFYTALENLEYAVVPMARDGYFTKNVVRFNNSTGLASKETGGNLIVAEQWIEAPHWKIVVKYREEFEELFSLLERSEGVYLPYLGKNDHCAEISNVEVIELDEVVDYEHIDSLFIKDRLDDFQFRGTAEFMGSTQTFYLEETMPNGLERVINHYTYNVYVHTNLKMFATDKMKVYQVDGLNVTFI